MVCLGMSWYHIGPERTCGPGVIQMPTEEKTPQKKVYEPSWLAGTSIGDVMFQADYFLKELALGEYTMPVPSSEHETSCNSKIFQELEETNRLKLLISGVFPPLFPTWYPIAP